MTFALLEDFVNELTLWEKAVGGITGLLISFACLRGILYKIWKNISQANKSLTDFLNIIPKLKEMTDELGSGNSLKLLLQRVENKLHCNDQQIKIVASCVGVSAFETDKNGMYTFVSKKWMETTGVTRDEALGNGWLNIVCEEEREGIYKEWLSCVAQNREFHCVCYLSRVETQEVSIIAWPIRNLDGSIEKFFGILL